MAPIKIRSPPPPTTGTNFRYSSVIGFYNPKYKLYFPQIPQIAQIFPAIPPRIVIIRAEQRSRTGLPGHTERQYRPILNASIGYTEPQYRVY